MGSLKQSWSRNWLDEVRTLNHFVTTNVTQEGGERGWGGVSQCKSPLSSSRKPRDPLAINNTVLITIPWLTQFHLHAEHFVWDTWPAPEATIPHCSVSPETTHRHLRTVHIETATGQPSSWSAVFLWRGRVFPTRMMFLVKKVLVLKKKLTNLLARDIKESKVSLRRRVVKRCWKTYFILI